jgi:hypothetical protein
MKASDFRKTALKLPDAVEGAHMGHADFRVGGKIFATLGHPDDNFGMVKLTPEQQEMVVTAEPDMFKSVPGGWGKGGATRVLLAGIDAATLASALEMAWRNTTTKTLPAAKTSAQKTTVKKTLAKKTVTR